MRRPIHLSVVLSVIALGFLACGGSTSSTTTTSTTTRALKGSLSSSSLSTLVKQTRFKSLKKATLACTDLQVCCSAYSGDNVVKDVDSSCAFSLDLPLNNFCYCAIFTGTDGDGDGCKDTWVGSLGCSENEYSGAIPVYADDDDTTDAIDVGEGTLDGTRVVTATDICTQVDQDDDGTDDADDTDDDGDGTSDESDDLNEIGCEEADTFDSNEDGTPDIFQAIWAEFFESANLSAATKNMSSVEDDEDTEIEDEFFTDLDDDDVPDACDADVNGDVGCSSVTGDDDDDCIPDDFDFCETDADADGIDVCEDCDDGDASSGFECFCDGDEDEDGVNACLDCDDGDDSVGSVCESSECETHTCAVGDHAFSGDFECQLFADEDTDDEFTTANSFCNDGCCDTR